MKLTKYLTFAFVAILIGIFSASCEDIGPGALEKPDGGDVTIDTIFASAEYAERVLWNSYRSLRSGIVKNGRSHALGQDLQEDITDLAHSTKTWGTAKVMYYAGGLNSSNASDPGNWLNPMCILPYGDSPGKGIYTFQAIRNCHTFLDHVHKVPDMTDGHKEMLKAEAKMIIAYNMTELFRNYGGVPWIGKVYAPDDDFTNPRLTAEATVDSIVKLIDEAVPELPWQIAEAEMSNWAGRFTQAGAMALKTRLLLFAASPLLNSEQPYLDGDAAQQYFTWYGGKDDSHWQRAATAAKDLIDKIAIEGGYALEMPATESVQGYRDAYKQAYMSRRSTEVLISIRDGYESQKRWGGGMYDTNLNYGGGTCTAEFMKMFPMADGTPITDPASGWDPAVDPLGTEGAGPARKYNRDPRLYETMTCEGDDFGGEVLKTWLNKPKGKHVPLRANQNSASTFIRKFIPGWAGGLYPIQEHHFAYMRLPEIYLSYAEALNELGQTNEALPYVNMVRNRVGLKDLEQVGSWDQASLRDQILNERACEFGFEQVRWFDMTRHKLENSFAQKGTFLQIAKNGSAYTYNYTPISTNSKVWWIDFDEKWYLLPFPLNEIQKGYGLIQNPGW